MSRDHGRWLQPIGGRRGSSEPTPIGALIPLALPPEGGPCKKCGTPLPVGRRFLCEQCDAAHRAEQNKAASGPDPALPKKKPGPKATAALLPVEAVLDRARANIMCVRRGELELTTELYEQDLMDLGVAVRSLQDRLRQIRQLAQAEGDPK